MGGRKRLCVMCVYECYPGLHGTYVYIYMYVCVMQDQILCYEGLDGADFTYICIYIIYIYVCM